MHEGTRRRPPYKRVQGRIFFIVSCEFVTSGYVLHAGSKKDYACSKTNEIDRKLNNSYIDYWIYFTNETGFFSLVLHTLTNIENNVLFVKLIPYLNTEYLFGVQKYTLSLKEYNVKLTMDWVFFPKM